MITREKFLELVQELDQLKEGHIVNQIKSLGIKGNRSAAYGCPFSYFVSKKLEVDSRCIGVAPEYINYIPADGTDTVIYTYKTKSGIAKFVSAFDLGKYPELELGRE